MLEGWRGYTVLPSHSSWTPLGWEDTSVCAAGTKLRRGCRERWIRRAAASCGSGVGFPGRAVSRLRVSDQTLENLHGDLLEQWAFCFIPSRTLR